MSGRTTYKVEDAGQLSRTNGKARAIVNAVEDSDAPANALRTVGPTLEPMALHGLAGDIVRAIEPHTESDPAAVLLTLLAGFGALIGPGPHAVADAAEHPPRIWPLIVGNTSKARKGSSYAQVRRILAVADPHFMSERVLAGFGSGEALVDAVAPQMSADGVPVAFDPRLLLIEPEFAGILSVCRREGSTLSTLLRQGWDGGRLQVRSRTRTAVADGSHVVVVGHITRLELLARMAESDAHGGLLNRFLVVAARRSKLLPDGGNLDAEVIEGFGRKIASFAEQARHVGILRRSPDAKARWKDIYGELADDDPGGLLGAVIARDSAQLLRLSVIFALLDGCHQIEVEHIEAAAAIWHYCRASAALVFGELTGDTVADSILSALHKTGTAGLSRTAISEALGRHVKRDRIDQACRLLVSRGLATEATEATEGRSRNVLRVAKQADEAKEASANKAKEGHISHKSLLSQYDNGPALTDDDLDRYTSEDES